jgi:hypothetical protein
MMWNCLQYPSSNIIRVSKWRMRWVVQVARIHAKFGLEKSGRRGSISRSNRRCEGNIKLELKDIWFEDVDYIHVAEVRG